MANSLAAPNREGTPITPLQATALGFAIVVLLCLLYARSFGTLPTGDDFGVLSPIVATYPGHEFTLRECFTPVHPSRYRPLELVTGILACDGAGHFSPVRFRVIALVGMVLAIGAFAAWCRVLAVPTRFALFGVMIYAFHPIHAGTAGAIDTSSTSFIFGTGFTAAVIAYRFPRASVVGAASLIGTLLASGFKEYGYGVPLLVMAAVFARRGWRPGWRALAAAALSGAVAILIHRGLHATLSPPGVVEIPPVRISPMLLAINFTLYAGGVVVAGYSPGIFQDHAPLHIAIGAAIACVIGLLCLSGVVAALRSIRRESRPDDDRDGESSSPGTVARIALLLVPGACLPNLIVMRASEVYLPGAVFCASLLTMAGLWSLVRYWPRWRYVAFGGVTLTVVALASCTWLKVGDIRDAGDDGQRIATAIRDVLPKELTPGAVIGVIVDHPRRQYSVFRFEGASAIGLPPAQRGTLTALRWFNLLPDVSAEHRYREVQAGPTPSHPTTSPSSALDDRTVPNYIVAIDDRTRVVTQVDASVTTYPGAPED